MKLMTRELEERFAEVGNQSPNLDPLVIAKFFNQEGSAVTWYATEYNKDTQFFYGYVTGYIYAEWKYFSLQELENLKLPRGLKIQRDEQFIEDKLSKVLKNQFLNNGY